MATCYKKLDKRTETAKGFPLKIAITHLTKTAYIQTSYYLMENEWDDRKEKIKSVFPNSGRANAAVNRKHMIVQEVIDELSPYLKNMTVLQIKKLAEARIDQEFEEKLKKVSPTVVQQVQSVHAEDGPCFLKYAADIADKFYLEGSGGSGKTINETISSLKEFTGKKTLPFHLIDKEFLKNYERWYLGRVNSRGEMNTINGFGFKAREIRRVFNRAIQDKNMKVGEDLYPFGRSGYSIKSEKTDNRNLDPGEIAKFYNASMELKEGSELWHHANYFKYYFECWGMNFADVAYLRVYQVMGGKLDYRRRKTRWSTKAKKFSITHSPIAQSIIDYYIEGKKPNDFVFPIIEDIYFLTDKLKDTDQELRNKKIFEKKFENKRANHLRRLKTLSKLAGLTSDITTYMARHSFFSIALQNGVSKSLISEMAGHANFQITENYLAGFSGEQLAEGASMVRRAVLSLTNGSQNSILSEKIYLILKKYSALLEQLNGLKS